VVTSSSPRGTLVIPSKSPPIPTCSTPATAFTCSMWAMTSSIVAAGAGFCRRHSATCRSTSAAGAPEAWNRTRAACSRVPCSPMEEDTNPAQR
jgi:hypothetical protein